MSAEVKIPLWRDEEIWDPPARKKEFIGYRSPQKVFLSFELDLQREVCGKDGWLEKNGIRINGQKVPGLVIEGDQEERRQTKKYDIDVTSLIPETDDPKGKKVEVTVHYKNPLFPGPPVKAECASPLKWKCSGRLTLWFTVKLKSELKACNCRSNGMEPLPSMNDKQRCQRCGNVILEKTPEETTGKRFCYVDGEALVNNVCPMGHHQDPAVHMTKPCANKKEHIIPSFARFCWYCKFKQPDIE